METRRDQQIRTESKTRAVVRIKMCLSSGDYARAQEVLRGTAAEFPNDAELSELEKLAQDGVKRNAEANRLITESQELFAQQKFSKAIQLLREAYDLDKKNSLARAILANALVEHAHSIVETDWWEAETLANEALALNPAHPTAKTIHSRILNQKEGGSVEEWVSQTSKLQSSGNLSAALSQIAEGLAVYPHEARLLQIQDTIQRDHGAERRQVRRRDLEELRRTKSEIDAVADVAAKQALAERVRALTSKHSTDGEILSVVNALLLRLGQAGVPQKSSTASSASAGKTVTHHAPPVRAAEASLAASSPVPPSPSVSSQIMPGVVVPGVVPQSKVLPSQDPAAQIPVIQVPSNPTTGIVPPRTASPSKIPPSIVPSSKVPPSIVPASKVLPSTAPASIVPPVKVETTPPEPRLAPQPPAIVPGAERVAPVATVTSPSSSSQPEQPTRSKSTRLILVSAAAIVLVAALSFIAGKHQAPPVAKAPAASPTISSPTLPAPAASAPTVSAPAVSAPAQTTPEPSLPTLPVSSDTAAGKATLDDQMPAGHNLGTLLVVAGQDNARVFLNGKPQRQLTQAGQLRLTNLELKDYVVQVSKIGFQDPPQQKIRIREGEQARVSFTLQPSLKANVKPNVKPDLQPNPQPQPRLASLTIQGGAPGTTVLVDQTPVGTVQPDGTLSVSTVNPGDHTVELRKERFKPRQFKKHFVGGGVLSLVAADAALEAALSELKITFTPADANVAIAKAGGLPTILSSGVPLNLAAGTYTLTARTAERFTRSSTLEVIAGQSKTLDLSLAPNGMSKWEDAGAWKHEGDSFTRKGGDFVLYGVVPASGSFAFSAMPTKGHVLQWVFNYTDPKNYVLFQMDDNNFYRTVIRNGEKTSQIIVPDRGDKKSFRTLHIRVTPTEIVHQTSHGDSWTVLDRWTLPGANLSLGKFGFYIPGNDQVTISNFSHYADLNLR